MKITEICIKNFGKLTSVKISPVDGVNIFYGKNETGKSTIMAFILAMLYGLGKGEQRRRYEPWEGGRISGSLTFTHGDKEYFLDRQFGTTRVADKTELFCKTTGEQLTLPDKTEPGEFILGICKESFVNSVYIGQAGVPIKGENREILARLTNLAASGDETASRTEIAERLSEAGAHLRSKRGEAILPRLERRRNELMEQRAEINKRAGQADTLRDSVVKLKSRREQLEQRLSETQKRSQVTSGIRELREIESVLQRKKSYETAKKEYEALHERIFPEGGALTTEYLGSLHDLLDEYKQQEVVIRLKQEQLDAAEKKVRAVDTTPLRKMKVLRRYSDEIKKAREDYAAYKEQYETMLETVSKASTADDDTKLRLQNTIIIGALAVVMFLLLGFIQKVFFIIAIIVACLVGAYVYIQKRDISFDGLPNDNIELTNLAADMHDINVRMQPVFDEVGVKDMDGLCRELYLIRDVRDRHTVVVNERDSVKKQLDAERDKLSGIMDKLKEALAPFTVVKSDEEALNIVSKLEQMLARHSELETRYQSETEGYTTALGGRDLEQLIIRSEVLRAQLSLRPGEMPPAAESDEDEVERCRAELDETIDELARRETELSLLSSDPQELARISDEIMHLSERIDRYEFEYSAIEEAQSALSEAFESMQKDFGPIINERAGQIMADLTGGKYTSVNISGDLYPSVAEPGGTIQRVDSLSGGTIDQIYLALRLALAGVLSEETLPLLLDDAFAQYDDKRMTEALQYLGKENSDDRIGQILMFTCHERVLTAAEQVGLEDGIIRMSE